MANAFEPREMRDAPDSPGLARRHVLQGGLLLGLAAMVGFPTAAGATVIWSHPFPNQTTPTRYWGYQPDGSHWPEYDDGFHKGLDYGRNLGTQVYAVAGGTVIDAGWGAAGQSWAGNGVLIEHSGGWHSYYAHLNSLDVQVGQDVSNGSEVGKVGSTGQALGEHLHIEIWKSASRADRTDPYPLIHNAPLAGVPIDQGDEVPTFLDPHYEVAKSFPLDWDWVRPADNNLSIASGGMVVVTSNVLISGLGTGIAKFRYVRYNATTGNRDPLEPLFIYGAGSGLATYGQLSAITSLGADTKLRLEMKADTSGVTLERIYTRGLRWA